MTFRAIYVLSLSLCLIGSGRAQQVKPVELPGAKDHALVSRYSGAVLYNAADERFAMVRVPAGSGRAAVDKAGAVEGHVSAYFYVGPGGRTALEIFRNYRAALTQTGFMQLFSCEMRACDEAGVRDEFRNEQVRMRKWATDRIDAAGSVDRDLRFLSAKLSRGGADTYVMVFVAEPNSIWQVPATVLIVAEPSALEKGQVVVDTERLKNALADEGRITLSGIYFDTDRAELKPESKAQLDAMAQLLGADKSLRVAIVGHTDNQGTVDGNLALSQRRAEAVAAELIAGYKIDPVRLRARGVANFAPVATNRNEAGRSRNRRVELIEQ